MYKRELTFSFGPKSIPTLTSLDRFYVSESWLKHFQSAVLDGIISRAISATSLS